VSYEAIPEVVHPPAAIIENRFVRLEIDTRGRCNALVDKRSGENLISEAVALAAIRAGGRSLGRTRCSYEDGNLTFTFGRDEAEAVIGVRVRNDYICFDVVSVRGDDIERLDFATLPLTLSRTMNRMSMLMAGEDFGVCLRPLNIDTMVSLDTGARQMQASATAQYGIIGCGAAVVACPMDHMRPALRQMVAREGLPQSDLGGPWALDAEGNRGSYLFANVTENTVDRWIDLALRGGFTHVHFSGWAKTLGHYEVRETAFPHGLAGMKECVRKIHAAGLKAGMHTLTGCIALRDSWVTPVPDPRLMAGASYTLAAEIDETSDTMLTVEKPGPHDTVLTYSSAGNVVRIGEELIQYSAISYEEPYGFLNCKRGALGTTPSAHAEGAQADHLRQRYGAFYPDENSTLVGEVADAIARVYNECEMDELYMDGAEGMGTTHGIWVMRDAIFRRLNPPALIEASCWDTWSWYFHSRLGAWDHPKWGLKDFTDMHCEQIPYYREGALLQAQLGWWVIGGPAWFCPAETPDEMEYFMCKTFAHNAPMSVQGIGAIGRPANARMPQMITTAGQYERLRLAKYFTDETIAATREPEADFHLRQAPDGVWEFAPTDYAIHKITGDGDAAWTIENRFEAQQIALRVEALFAARAYDSDAAITLADVDPELFSVRRNAGGVTSEIERVTDEVKIGDASLRMSATNSTETRVGAWAHTGAQFEPNLNLSSSGAMGLWVHGDGKGELLNVQLSTPPQYQKAYSEHYIHVDFTGWRYFDLLLRERSSDEYRDYKWPYFSQHGIFRTAINRAHVSELNLYLNNLAPGETSTVLISPIVALPTVSLTLKDPAITVGGAQVVLPVTLRSGDFAEVDASGECIVYDARGEMLARMQLTDAMPTLAPGSNALELSSAAATRAEVTVTSEGSPMRERRPKREVNWQAMRYEYEMPQLVETLDGRQNTWQVACRPDGGRARLGVEVEVRGIGATGEAYASPDALTIESFDDLGYFADAPDNEFAKYVYDGEHKGVSTKPGVTQEIARSTDVVKIGESSARFSATSTREDNGGWSARGRRFAEPLDLSPYGGLGFWLHGDGGGESFKVQLRDTVGAWHDMVTRVDFSGWRYIEFDLAGANLDLSQIEYLIIFFNGIPSGRTVTCHMDDLRGLPAPERLRNPELRVDGSRVVIPTELGHGDRLVFRNMNDCRVYRRGVGVAETVRPEGKQPVVRPGSQEVTFALAEGNPERFRLAVGLVKDYR
jgi:hypothetical protein